MGKRPVPDQAIILLIFLVFLLKLPVAQENGGTGYKQCVMFNFAIVKDLITKHLEITEQLNLLAAAGVQIETFDQLNLFDIALDVIGFPKDNTKGIDFEELTELHSNGKVFSRDKWDFIVFELKKEDVDDFVKQLYAEYDELILKQPYLFVKE